MTDVRHDNRRIHTRHRSRVHARLVHEGGSVEGHLENIGEGGVFFGTEDLELVVDEGSEVTLSFECRRNGVLTMVERPGVVLRTERYFDGEAVVRAFAVKFDELLVLDAVAFA